MNSIDKLKYDPLIKIVFEDLLEKDIVELDKQFDKTKSDLIAQSDEIKKVIVHAELNNWHDIKTIYNTIGFIVLASLDLKTYTHILAKAKDSIDKIAIVRMIYTQAYEIGEDLNFLTGKMFQKALVNINANNELIEIKQVRTELTQFKNIYDHDLKSLRITVGAHREQNYLSFHDTICSLDYTSGLSLVIKLDKILNNIGLVLAKIMNSCLLYAKEHY
jgi:hypothetical protein